MYDIHTHLYWHSYDEDREEVLRRARGTGVEKMLVVGTTIGESRQAIELAEQYPELSASVGIHPHAFNEAGISNLTSWIGELRKLTISKKTVAIGECGLDYYSHASEKDISEKQKADQEVGFLAQLDLARELRLPVIIHCRNAYERMYEILKEQCSKFEIQDPSFILHCYMGDTEVTEKFLTLPNVYFSFTANITYPIKKSIVSTKDDLTETVKLVPLDRIFTETDCPFLAPQGERGGRNEPAWVMAVAEQIANLQGISREEVEAKTIANAKRVFGI